jgi:type II secretory pathway component PulK
VRHPESGFALITVLGVVLIVTAVAMTLASTMRVEALQVLGDRTSVDLEELARSGQEMALYLTSRGLGTPAENLDGLPVEAEQPGFHYIVHFPNADVHLYLDAEDGKLNLSTSPDVVLEGFFTVWSGDSVKGSQLAAAVKDWRDVDDAVRPGGAEAETYAPLGYLPRNAALGVGDWGLLRGVSAEDFRDRLLPSGTERRTGLSAFLTLSPVGSTVNPNFASELVLRAIPGLSELQAQRVVAERQNGLFKDPQDLARRAAISESSPAWAYLHFTRKTRGILSLARTEDGRVVRSERRVTQPFSRLNLATGSFEAENVHGLVERNFPLEYVGPTLR